MNIDFYKTKHACKNRKQVNTNPKYKHFTQTHYTAGDDEEFEKSRSKTQTQSNEKIIIPRTIFPDDIYYKFKSGTYQSVSNTFQYIFHKFKKGIYISIRNNKLETFLPFSNVHFVNEWSDKVIPEGVTPFNYLKSIDSYYNVNPSTLNLKPNTWYANNCLVRYEYPIKEGDTNHTNIRDMFIELCKERQIPDIEFFVNRRDFPLLKKNETEAYNHIFGNNQKLLSHNYTSYAPILSVSKTNEFADLLIPTGEDWARVEMKNEKYFFKYQDYPFDTDFTSISWKNKKDIAVFRGSSTGSGTTIDTNMRLKLAFLSTKNKDYLDCGITKWNNRPRKLSHSTTLQTIDVLNMNKLGIFKVNTMTPLEQARYKYIINVDGHVSAFRLSFELGMRSCILLVESNYKMWCHSFLIPYVHYVPIKDDLSDLLSQIKWCREHDKKCEEMAENAYTLYNQYLVKNGILNYLQSLLVTIKLSQKQSQGHEMKHSIVLSHIPLLAYYVAQIVNRYVDIDFQLPSQWKYLVWGDEVDEKLREIAENVLKDTGKYRLEGKMRELCIENFKKNGVINAE